MSALPKQSVSVEMADSPSRRAVVAAIEDSPAAMGLLLSRSRRAAPARAPRISSDGLSACTGAFSLLRGLMLAAPPARSAAWRRTSSAVPAAPGDFYSTCGPP